MGCGLEGGVRGGEGVGVGGGVLTGGGLNGGVRGGEGVGVGGGLKVGDGGVWAGGGLGW